MTAILFDYPQSAAFGRVLPKSKLYERAHPSSALKKLFVQQVEQIVWQYKLAPETINVPSTPTVPEIEIFTLTLKGDEFKEELLRCIDLAIPFPIIYELQYESNTRIVAAHKRPSESDGAKWIVSDYFKTNKMPCDTPRAPLPLVRNLENLYAHLLTPLLPYPPLPGENLGSTAARMGCIRLKQRECDRCAVHLLKERQFNRKVALNAELRLLKNELESLINPPAEA